MNELIKNPPFYFEYEVLNGCYFGRFKETYNDEMIALIFRSRGNYFVFDSEQNTIGSFANKDDAIDCATDKLLNCYFPD